MKLRKKISAAVLFSGGKDSFYALLKSVKKFNIKCLISLKPLSKESYMFHFPNIDLIKLQGKALNIPSILIETKGEKEKELKDLKKAILIAKKKFKIEALITGSIASNYQKSRIDNICNKLKLKSITVIWKKDPKKVLKDMISKLEIIIVGIAADGFDEKWLGRELDLKAFNDLKNLSKKFKIHLLGEGGEFETFVLDAPIFNKKIKIIKAKKIMENKNTGYYIIKKAKLIKK